MADNNSIPRSSWRQTGPNTWTQPWGFQEVLYNAISVPPGSSGLFILGSAIIFTPPSSFDTPDHLSALFRHAWLQVLHRYPIVAAESHKDGKRYTPPSSPADLEGWLKTTFIVSPAKSWTEIWHSLVKTRKATLYHLPCSNQLFLQAEHSIVDGRGVMHLWDTFFHALIAPMPQSTITAPSPIPPTLPPRSDDLLPIPSPNNGTEQALQLLAPLSSITSPVSIPRDTPLPVPSPHNGVTVLKLSKPMTTAIKTACKSHNITVTSAWHAAVALATETIQSRHGIKGTHFATFGNFDLRRYFPPSKNHDYTVGNHHCVLPHVLNVSDGRTLVDMAKELIQFYGQDLDQPRIWSALGPMVEMLVPEFTKEPLEETTPAVSSLGVVDGFIKREYGGWTVDDAWFGNTVTGPWLECFSWAWRGRLCLNVCWNRGFYTEEEVRAFNSEVLEELVGGLGVGWEAKL
ncbi:hypothetical protein OQA88_609 [Cercophora sp. LCS_1]